MRLLWPRTAKHHTAINGSRIIRPVQRYLNWVFNPIVSQEELPPRCTLQLRDRLDDAIRALEEPDRYKVTQFWFLLDDEERLLWAQRRKSVLLILWVRGGAHGFDGLGVKLSEALDEIDR